MVSFVAIFMPTVTARSRRFLSGLLLVTGLPLIGACSGPSAAEPGDTGATEELDAARSRDGGAKDLAADSRVVSGDAGGGGAGHDLGDDGDSDGASGTDVRDSRGPDDGSEAEAGPAPGRDGPADAPPADVAPDAIALNPTAGSYRGICDGSAAAYVDADYFLDANDEGQAVRIYRRGASANAVQQIDIGKSIGKGTTDEADIEDAARVGDRVYFITSHGRNKDGDLEPTRYRFFAFDLAGTAPKLTLTVAGSSSSLLAQMLVAANWVTPDTAFLALLANSSQLAKTSAPTLAPTMKGTNIEGLAALPTAARPGQLVIGFRNPQVGAKAVLVTLLNADAVIAGTKASFGEVISLDLDGLGIRGLAWSPMHQALLILGGPRGDGGPFRLYKWSGDAARAPAAVADLAPPSDSAPEAIVVYPNTKDVQVLFDEGDRVVDGDGCKKAAASRRAFTDVIVHVD